ncbi:uncharacterized protein LOC110708535 [Chenopodium quinoa]|uniref:uncharacterized protein LOC110708535 n=1 Tax=Chenopodium quinoa TaxID=63459 RepID=UPI000B76BC06|nr:uncharacterized protein LOC110708535 [Chenopodium quinoa]
MAAGTLQQTSADLKKSRAVLHQLTDTFQSIQSHVYSVMALSDQWGTFQNSFVSVQHSLGSHIKELEVKERETNSLRIALDNREKEVELRRKKLEFDENSLSEGCKELEMRERDYSERVQMLELEKKRVKEWFKAAEAKERRIEQRTVAVEEREREVEVRERREGCGEVEERERRVEEREKEIDKRSEAVEMGENGINKRCIELERREKEVEERNRVAELREEEMVVKEKRIDERFEEIGLREKGIDELCRVQELRDKELSEKGKGLELKEKEIDERCNVVELREVEIEQRCKGQELRDEQLNEQCKELELREKRIDERLGELELREKKIGERCRVVELREAKFDQRCKVQELRDKQLKERREELEVIEKHIDECLEKLKLKEKEIDERCCVAELKEKAIDERCSVAELKEKHVDECLERLKLKKKEIDERCSVAELKEKAVDERCSVAELKEKHIDECLERLKLKEKEVDERCSVVELKEKAIDERCKVVESREREIDERSKGQELREKQLNKQCKGLQLKEKRIGDRLGELELKEKKIGERCSVVELREAEINQHCKAQELRDQQLNERCEELELKEKEIIERCSVVELKEKATDESCKVAESREEIDERCKGQELRDKQLNKRSKWLQLKEKHIDGRLKELELKEKHIDGRLKELELKENQIELKYKQTEEACEELELKEKRMIEHTEEKKLKDKQISEKCGELELKEKHINESFKSLDSKVEHINKRCKDLSLREKLISDRSKALDLKEKKMYEQSQALELKEKEISRHAKAEELGEGQRDVHIKALVLKGKKINKCFQEQECKKNEINDPCTKLELEREQLSDTTGMTKKSEQNSSLGFVEGLQSLSLKQCMTDGKALQMFLNDRVDEHRFMEEEIRDALRLSSEPGRLVLAACVGFFSPHLKNGDVMYETSAVRSSCVLLLEQLMNLKLKVDKGLKKNAKKVFFLWKEKMRENGQSRIVVLSFLLLIVAFGLSSIVNRDELQRLYKIVDQDRIAPRLHQELNLFKANEGSNMLTGPLELTTGQQLTDILQGTDTVASPSINQCSVINLLCHRMDAKGLRLYIREHMIDQIISPEKILDALLCAPDPAKLLLNVVQIFNQPKATPVEKTNCIFLLEQLMKLQKRQRSINSLGQVEQLVKPPSKITLGLKKQAKKFAYTWKQTLAKTKGYKILEVYGFLQFLATYEIASLFNENELFRLFKKCYGGRLVFRPEQNPYLCRTLGLEKRISGLIKSLVKEDRRLQAVKYICTFMMESYFPLAPLLKDHLKFTKEKSVKLRKERNNSHAAKIESARFEMHHLQDVLKYINDYKLESEFTDVSLELRIEELEKQIAELKTSTTEEEQMVTTEEGLIDDSSINLEVDMVEIGSTKLGMKAEKNLLHPADTASELFGGKKRTSSPSPSFVLPQEKRLKAGALVSNRQWPQPGPCTSGHQAHVKPDEFPVSHPVTLPAINGLSAQSGLLDNSYGASATPTPCRETQQIAPTARICPGGIDVELKTTTARVEQKLANKRKEDLKNTFSANIEKDIVENNSIQGIKKAEKILSPAFSEIVAESCGEKYFSSPSSSSVLPQQAKHLRPQTFESPNPPPNYPISMNPPLPSLQSWGQHRPYTFGHVAHDGPNGALHPGQMPAVNGPSAQFGGPSGSYGVNPCWGTGEFRPTAVIFPGDTLAPQFRPTAGIGPGSTTAHGQFRPYAGFGPGDTHSPVQFRPAAGIGPGSTPTPGQWPSAGIGPGNTPGQYGPAAGIGSGSIPGQYRPTAGSYPDGPPAPGQFWPTAGISSNVIPTPGYFVGSQVPPYRP